MVSPDSLLFCDSGGVWMLDDCAVVQRRAWADILDEESGHFFFGRGVVGGYGDLGVVVRFQEG